MSPSLTLAVPVYQEAENIEKVPGISKLRPCAASTGHRL